LQAEFSNSSVTFSLGTATDSAARTWKFAKLKARKVQRLGTLPPEPQPRATGYVASASLDQRQAN